MSNSNGIITAPVDVVSDVAYVLGASSGDIGTLCQNININPASRKKPFAYNAPGFATSAAYEAALKARNCGLTVTKYTSLSAVGTAGLAVNVGGLAWTYEAPRGVANNEWFRLLDFDGYRHYGVEWPFQYTLYPNPCYKLDSPSISDEAHPASLDGIQLTDLNGDGTTGASGKKYANLKDLNFGVIIYSGSEMIFAKSFTSSPTSVVLSPSGNVTYDVVTFFTDQTINSTSPVNGDFYLAPIPHSQWNYYNTLGVNYNDTYIQGTKMNLRLSARAHTMDYYKLQVLVKQSDETLINTVDVNSGSSGQLTTSSISSFLITIGSNLPSGVKYYLRYWTTSVAYYDERFFPQDSPQE